MNDELRAGSTRPSQALADIPVELVPKRMESMTKAAP
jgi:hypothetical protein